MARARAIETRLEKLVPALDEYFSTGFLSRDEIQELSRMRTRFEYKLVAKPLLLLDVRNAITFELELEEKLRTYCLRTKVSLKHRWSIISRIETIYQIGLKHVRLRREKDALQDDYVRFLRYYNRHGSLSKLYAQLMILYPTRSSTWVEAAEWEGISLNKMDNARIIIQQALRTMSEDAEVWACAVKLELHFASRLLSGLVEEHREEQRKRRAAKPEEEVADEIDLAARLRAENAALGKILVDLELAKSVVAESVEAPTSTPHVLQRQLQAAGEFPFAADVVRAIVEAGIDRWSSTVVGDGAAEKQKQREVWAADGAQMMHNFIMADHLMASGCAQSPMADVEAFLRHGCSSTEPPPPLVDGAQRYAATLRAMISLIELYASATRGNKNDPAAMLVQRIRVGPQCDAHLSTVMSSLLSFFAEKQASGVSAMCRAMLENPADVSGAKVAQWLMSGTGKALTRAQKEEMVEPAVRRVAELVERIGGDLLGTPATSKRRADESTSSNPFAAISDVLMRYVLVDEMDSTKRGKTATASSLSAMELHTLMAWWRAEEAKKSKTSVRVAAALRLLQRCGLAPSTPAKAGETEMLAVLRQALFHIATGHHDGGSSKLPLTLWRMCSALEALPCSEVDGAPSSSSSRNKKKKADVPSGSDSDDEDEEDVGAAKNTQPHAFADIGLLWLAAADAATLDASSEADRIDGVCTLLRSRLASLTGLRRPTRGDVVELLRQSQATAPWVAAMQRSMSYARRCAPFPRYAFTSVVLPVVEGLADYHANARTSAAREVKTAMADARSCHEALLALYRQSPHLNQFQAVLFHGGDDEKMSGMTASTQRAVEANTADWLAYICFEREVAKDLHRAKEAVARATKDALHAQSVVARLQRM